MLSFFMSIAESMSDREKVEMIYNSYYGLMMYIAGKYLSDPRDREDVVQDSLIKIIKNIDKIDVDDKLRTKSFCATVVRHTALDNLRKKENRNIDYDSLEDIPDEKDDPLEITINNETVSLIMKAIDGLSDTYRNVCRLKYINRLKEKEIAEVLDLPLKTVNLRIFRGKQILRQAIRKDNGND